ncbi:MAG TPA: hypothetical protein VMP41_02375 [Acidimicrobiales bacterium]|nr:hypothetical protein [Acidimicrobiales bacterium]
MPPGPARHPLESLVIDGEPGAALCHLAVERGVSALLLDRGAEEA